jgi:hypothetical protein
MLIPLLVLGLALYFFLGWLAIKLIKPVKHKQIMRYLIIFAVFICTADHIVGYLYARAWLEMAQGQSDMNVDSNVMAFERIILDEPEKPRPTVSQEQIERDLIGSYAEKLVGLEFRLVREVGLSSIQVRETAYNLSSSQPQWYELKISTDSNDPNCSVFFKYFAPEISEGNKNWFERWKKAAAFSLDNGEAARCIAIKQIPKMTSWHLLRTIFYPASSLERWLGVGNSKNSTLLLSNNLNLINGECRSLWFHGGWVQRFIFIGDAGEHPFFRLTSTNVCPNYSSIKKNRLSN